MTGERIVPTEGRVVIELRVTYPWGVIERRVVAAEHDLSIEGEPIARLAGGRTVTGRERIRLNALVESEL